MLDETRLRVLLYNTLVALEGHCGADFREGNLLSTDLADEIGITQEEYDEIMEY